MPIKPEDVASKKLEEIPKDVFEVWDKEITKKYSRGRSKVMQNDIVNALCSKFEVSRGYVFDSGWLNVEEAYTELGWEVSYDKPGYSEEYPAHFLFKVP